MSKEREKLLKELLRQGFTYTRTSKQHYMVRSSEGTLITTLSGTASDHRALRNSIAQLRRAGFVWPR